MATISTTPKPTYVYDNTTDTWYPVGSVALANMRTFEYFAAQGQTVFTGADSTGTVMAYTENPENTDYQRYLEWVAAGGVPEPWNGADS